MAADITIRCCFVQHLSVTSPIGAKSGPMIAMAKKDPLAPIRRKKLRAWIDGKYAGNRSKAAGEADKPPRQFIELLNNAHRSFGGKLAREIEEKLRMPKHYLDMEDPTDLEPIAHDSWIYKFVTREIFEGLNPDQKQAIGYWVQGRIAGFEDEAPNAARTKRHVRDNGKS
jgi:hypothetical protein